jgi:hypothetical protein
MKGWIWVGLARFPCEVRPFDGVKERIDAVWGLHARAAIVRFHGIGPRFDANVHGLLIHPRRLDGAVPRTFYKWQLFRQLRIAFLCIQAVENWVVFGPS